MLLCSRWWSSTKGVRWKDRRSCSSEVAQWWKIQPSMKTQWMCNTSVKENIAQNTQKIEFHSVEGKHFHRLSVTSFYRSLGEKKKRKKSQLPRSSLRSTPLLLSTCKVMSTLWTFCRRLMAGRRSLADKLHSWMRSSITRLEANPTWESDLKTYICKNDATESSIVAVALFCLTINLTSSLYCRTGGHWRFKILKLQMWVNRTFLLFTRLSQVQQRIALKKFCSASICWINVVTFVNL